MIFRLCKCGNLGLGFAAYTSCVACGAPLPDTDPTEAEMLRDGEAWCAANPFTPKPGPEPWPGAHSESRWPGEFRRAIAEWRRAGGPARPDAPVRSSEDATADDNADAWSQP